MNEYTTIMFSFPKVLKNIAYRNLYLAGFTSELGSFALETALKLQVYQLSGNDKTILGIAHALFLTFFVLGNLIGSPFGEKHNKKNILIFCEIIRIPILLSLFFSNSIPLLLIVQSLIAFFTGVFNPSRQALINLIVPNKDMNQANSLFGTTMAVIHVAGPLIGAQCYALFGGITEIVIFDITSFLIGIFLLLTIKVKSTNSIKKVKIVKDMYEGFLHAKKDRALFALLINVIVMGMAIGILIPLLIPFSYEVLKGDAQTYSYLISLFGIGGILGGYVCNLLAKKFTDGAIILLSTLGEVMMMFIWLSLITPVWINLSIMFIWGIVVFIRIPAQLNYISHNVETKFITRTFSILDLAFVVPNMLGGVIVSLVGETFSTLEILWSTAFIFLILFILRVPIKGTRELFYAKNKNINRDLIIEK